MWASLPATTEASAILFSNNAFPVSFGRKSNWLGTKIWIVPGAVWKVLHVKSKTGELQLFDSFVKCEKKSYFSGAVLWVFVLSKREALPVKMEKGSCKWPQQWQPDLRVSESWNWKISPKFWTFWATAEELFCIKCTNAHSLLYHRRQTGSRKPNASDLYKMLPKRVTDHGKLLHRAGYLQGFFK